LVGTVKNEDARGVQIAIKKGEQFVPAGDIIDIHYDEVKPVKLTLSGGAYLEAKKAEAEADAATDPALRRTATTNAIKHYKETMAQMKPPHKYAARNFDYKVAVLTLRQAQGDPIAMKDAMARLDSFKTRYPNSWQINQIVPTLAQLQMDAKDFKGAIATYQEMADLEVFPVEVRRNAELMVVQVTVKSGDFKGAQKKLDDIEKKAAGNVPFLSRVKMTRAELLVGEKKIDQAVPILKQLIKDNKDAQIKAEAHNTLGECLFKSNRYSEAVWEFLYVDAVYNQDRNERAKALYYLWKTFEQLNNDERSKECRRMLMNDPQFQGSEWRLRASKEGS
ncbi:MAG TPA: tetratricopeptide repeat protein, partial [Gemmataceae bacterium]|nr:tetratricopeptide repeat protein [Gemmataceae bacterium]